MAERLAAAALAALKARGLTLATAESCTGGLLGAALTEISGASQVYLGGVISYAYAAKETLLGVEHSLLCEQGAVSEAVARQMAAGVRARLGASFGVGITGNAGPTADPQNPNVGEIYVACAGETQCVCHRLRLSGNRAENRAAAVEEALRLLLASLA